jgi:regulator of chromosome condensation
MAKLIRKRKAVSLVSEGNTTPGPTKKAKTNDLHTHSFESIRASRYKTINEKPKVKTTPLDIFVWGSGSMCELGLGPAAKTKEVKRPRLNPFLKKDDVGIVDFAVGGMHVIALDKSNNLWSWGTNDSGVLGRDTSAGAEKTLRDIDSTNNNEDEDDEDSDLNEAESTPGKVEGLPKDDKIVKLAASDNLSVVLLESGEVWAWGTFRNNEGILGFSKDIKIQKEPIRINELENIVSIVAGKDHILALDNKGLVYAWGNGQQYQLGRKILERSLMSSLEPRSFGLKNIKFIGSGEFHSFAITTKGKVLVWGLNQYGQCGINMNIDDGAVVTKPTEIKSLSDKDIVYITGGEHNSLAISSTGEVYTFGRYDMKEIGIEKEKLPLDDCIIDNHGNVRSLPIPTKLTTLPPIKSISCGSHHSLAITKDGLVFSWGFADTYAVGLGNLDDDVAKPTRIDNTATRDHEIEIIGCGGQFSVSGGFKIDDESKIETRLDSIEKFEEELNEMKLN